MNIIRENRMPSLAETGSPRRYLPFSVVCIWIILLAARAVASFTALDRLPLVPSVPAEVLINDPALALSKGYGLVGFSFEHSWNGLDLMYAHFPPVFVVLQSLVYRIFGFSALTLRASSALCELAACVVFLMIFRELYKRRIVDGLGLALGSILLLLEPTLLIQSRQGRMESTNILLGGLALYLCVRAGRNKAKAHRPPVAAPNERGTQRTWPRLACPLCAGSSKDTLMWVAAAVLTGVALATHPSAIVFWAALCAWSLLRFRSLGLVRWIVVNALPPLVFAAIWVIAYGTKAAQALQQMRRLASYAPKPTLALNELVSILARGALSELPGIGGLVLPCIVAALVLGWWRVVTARTRQPVEAPPEWWPVLLCFSTVLLVQSALIQFVLPSSGPNRVVMVVPFAFLCAAVAVSHLPSAQMSSLRKFAAAGIALTAVLQLGMLTAYFSELRHSWRERNPARLDAIVDTIPADARVVAVPEFWFAFRRRDRQIALAFHSVGENRYWSETPGAFDSYDVVILDPVTPDYPLLLEKARIGHPVERLFRTYKRNFMVLAKPNRREAGASEPGRTLAPSEGLKASVDSGRLAAR